MIVVLSPERHLWTNKQDVQVLDERVLLQSYQVYVVEQWSVYALARSAGMKHDDRIPNRQHLNKTVVAYTGNKSHRIHVCAVQLEKNKSNTLSLMESDKARPMDVVLQHAQFNNAIIYVTNLNSFPSVLNIVHLPEGDYETHIAMLNLNLNLRRMACSGRSALSFTPPSEAQKDRFNQIYKTNTRIEFQELVFEFIKLVQSALYVLGLLPVDRMDGLLCDETTSALQLFQDTFGPFELEIQGSMCDPILFTALVSKVMTLRNKLHAMGVPCPKNPFSDYTAFQSAVASYQKSHKLEATGFLNKTTVERINDSSVRASPPLRVHKVIKSKMEDFSGPHQIDLETTDLDQLLQHMHLDTFRLLWGRKTKASVLQEAETLIQGGKELGLSLLKNVSNKAPKVPEKYRDGGANLMKEIRSGVTKFSNSVEGFVDRARIQRRERTSPTRLESTDESEKTTQVTESSVDAELMPVSEYLPLDFDWDGDRPPWHPTDAWFDHLNMFEQLESVPQRLRACTDPSLFDIEWQHPDVVHQIQRLNDEQDRLEELVRRMKGICDATTEKIKTLSEIYVGHWHEFADAEKLLNALIVKHRTIQTRIDQLETQNSKLHYEMATLEEKYKEAEESMDSFEAKVKLVDQSLSYTSRSQRATISNEQPS